MKPATMRVLLACVAGMACGCAKGELDRLVPVQGQVIVNGKPLTKGDVSFRPDAANGNTTRHIPVGKIDGNGKYELKTAGKLGAPPGRYKVLVICQDYKEPGETKGGVMGEPKSLIHTKYLNPETTDLSVEVVDKAPAGSYDLQVTK